MRRRVPKVRLSLVEKPCLKAAFPFIAQQPAELGLRQPVLAGLPANAVTKLLELLCVQGAQALVLVGGQQHGDIPLLPTNQHRLALRRVEQDPSRCLASVAETSSMLVLLCLI